MSIVMIVLSNKEYNSLKRKAYRKYMSVERYIKHIIEREIGNEKTVSN